MDYYPELEKFILQAQEGDLKTKDYTKSIGPLSVRVSFGQGASARVPWIAFLNRTQNVQKGIYPVILYYKSKDTLIFAYGVSETETPSRQWPLEVIGDAVKIEGCLNGEQERYGESYVFRAYKVEIKGGKPILLNLESGEQIASEEFNLDLNSILNEYTKIFSETETTASEIIEQEDVEDVVSFGLEAHLEDFIVSNWDNLRFDFAKEYEVYKDDGRLVGKQYPTDHGRIDILAKKKEGSGWLVIELKKGKTSDKVVGQIGYYMGYVGVNLAEDNEEVRGIIIAGKDDERIKYAVQRDPNIQFMTYAVIFNLTEPSL